MENVNPDEDNSVELFTSQKKEEKSVTPEFRNRSFLRGRSFSNIYSAKKTVAQGMMDIALITANANQLRYLIEFCSKTPTFYVIFFLIILSLCLQVIVGVFLIFKRRADFRLEKLEHAIRLNNHIVLGVFLITIVNVFIAAFSVNISATNPSIPIPYKSTEI